MYYHNMSIDHLGYFVNKCKKYVKLTHYNIPTFRSSYNHTINGWFIIPGHSIRENWNHISGFRIIIRSYCI